MTPDEILKDAKERMDKAVEHLRHELRGVRTGRASTALVDFLKVDYYGSPTELKSLASVNVPEPTTILIKPFDAGATNEIKKALEASDLGLNPQVDGKQIRIPIPSLSTERRKQLAGHCRKIGEETKISIRNVRRGANKHADTLKKSTDIHYSEDSLEDLKNEIQEILKRHEKTVDALLEDKTREIMEV